MSKFDISNLIGREVRVYLDLTPGNHCWSIAEPKSSGRVLNYSEEIKDGSSRRVKEKTQSVGLRNTTFIVQPAGPQRVRSSGKKDVHAWVRGTLTDVTDIEGQCTKEVTYNAYKFSSFVFRESEIGVDSADMVAFSFKKCPCCGHQYPSVTIP